jgi:hypothetical protein
MVVIFSTKYIGGEYLEKDKCNFKNNAKFLGQQLQEAIMRRTMSGIHLIGYE